MKKTAQPKAFNIYFDTLEHVRMLTMEQRGELFTALYEYAAEGKSSDFDDGMVKMAFSFMRAQIDRDFEKYRDKCEKNRECVLKRYEKKNESTNVYERSQESDESTNVYECYQEEKEEEKNKEYKKEEDKEKEREEDFANLSDSLSGSNIDYSSVKYSFNRICPLMVTVDVMTESRKKAVDNAAEILGNVSFEELFERVQGSDFLSGKNGKWYGCNFDWILKPENLRKILSGAYDNPEPTAGYTRGNSPEKRHTSYDIKELMKIETLDFMDEEGWKKKAFGREQSEAALP